MDVQRNRDAAGWTAQSARPRLSASPGAGFATASSSLVGGASEGGLLATFDAIFRQTLGPEPASLDAATPAPSSVPAAPADYAAPKPSGPSAASSSPTAAASDDEEQDDDRRAEPSAATLDPQALPPSEAAEHAAADDDEQLEAADVDPAAAKSEPAKQGELERKGALGSKGEPELKGEPESNDEPELAKGSVAPLEAEAAESAGDGSEPSAHSPQDPDAAEEEVVAAAQTSPLAGATPPPTPTGDAPPQEPAVDQPSAALEATGQAGDSPEGQEGERVRPATEQPLPAAVSPTGEPSAAAVEASDPASAEGERPRSEASQPVVEASPENSAADGSSHGGRDSGNRDENRRHERSGDDQRPAGGQRNADSASRDRAIDQLVSQMKPLESTAEVPPPPSVGTPSSGASPQPLAGAAAAAAPPAATSAAAKAEGVESTATSGDRLSLDGGEARRSVGSVKGEAGEGRVQGGSNADRVRLVQRVARAFQRLGPEGGRVQVMLHPAELGSVRLDLRIDGQRMEGRMTAESEAARSVLREHLPELRQRLADSGLLIERFEIEVDGRAEGEGRRGGEAAFGQGERQGQGSGERLSWQRGRQSSVPLGRPAAAAPATASAASPSPFAPRTSLDFVA
ncbi:flagellar hook-length control protein FliK [Candidatus Laterigemmans baculatus]|uniref:flagellar hook-length control protein FliK n=1 Tax=Candidatus Laterigemmans baculatus TaxID=2770505 RepID=UPI0013DC31D6|nr:flagellar hook-length control protein FliK [Candidatus Laterigemmans baculatus]